MTLPWTEKYKPRVVKDFVNNGKALTQLNQWLISWKEGNPKKSAAFLHGPPGVGKTTCVEVLAKEHHFDLISLDSSDWRTKKALEKISDVVSIQYSLFTNKMRLILFDELEGMSGSQDRGGIATIGQLIRKKAFPIILIGNTIWNRKFSSFRNACVIIKFQRIPKRSIVAHLKRICAWEGIEAEIDALQHIAERAKGDLRSAITDLQALSQNETMLEYDDVGWLGRRDRKEAIFNILSRVFNASTCIESKKAVELADIDYEMLFEWIYENVPYQLSDIQDLSDALDALSRSDIYLTRTRTHQNWKLLKYAFDQMTAGVTTAKKRSPNRWVRYKFPGRILKMSQSIRDRRLRREIGLRFSEKLHMGSDAIIKEVLPFLKIIFEYDEDTAQSIIDEFELDDKIVDYLKKGQN